MQLWESTITHFNGLFFSTKTSCTRDKTTDLEVIHMKTILISIFMTYFTPCKVTFKKKLNENSKKLFSICITIFSKTGLFNINNFAKLFSNEHFKTLPHAHNMLHKKVQRHINDNKRYKSWFTKRVIENKWKCIYPLHFDRTDTQIYIFWNLTKQF